MYAGGVLKQIDGLTYDKLTYFVRSGYVLPRKAKKGNLYYNDFSEEDIALIKRAWKLISGHNMRARAAFARADEHGKAPQLSLDLKEKTTNLD
jgi:DNA-binding transcriptional MerR regulator